MKNKKCLCGTCGYDFNNPIKRKYYIPLWINEIIWSIEEFIYNIIDKGKIK